MERLTFNDFTSRISIQDVLRDAGYQLNRRDGLRYPSYIRLGVDGKRVHGDKFIVTANGLCCFQPPERKNYNVISFIKSFPELFAEYTPGMNADRLVNLVCNRLLNHPVEDRNRVSTENSREAKPFDVYDYDTKRFCYSDWESQKSFYPYFKNRGLDLKTQKAFCDCFFLATKQRSDGKNYTNLCFPLMIPGAYPNRVVGMEERSRPNKDGKTAYKGIAAGSDAANGLWIARLLNGRSDEGVLPLGSYQDVYWFESAFDAMAFYQLNRDKMMLDNAAFISTSGNPSVSQIRGALEAAKGSYHHLCFDNDKAGHAFALTFAMVADKRVFTSSMSKEGQFVISDFTQNSKKTIDLNSEDYDFDAVTNRLNIDTSRLVRRLPQEPFKDWNEQLLGQLGNLEEQEQKAGLKR